jgi:hypothetical protein
VRSEREYGTKNGIPHRPIPTAVRVGENLYDGRGPSCPVARAAARNLLLA